ncbi:MAG: adenosylhomocysteinase [Candidatus Fischerbacteria bacterium RBG_13_37_8]|uniref:Adenosylhomocysteinase n=1 Tax=Candidatus Fischerbacteria bacterium RBG_13_37_8 TaxID=1817863 RepID=A0A1F5VFP1_9BACT|nr:MAG: adenosylhomocysteinase [Candidatus Fischerbacteria bacterium RBG_13_37_8]
MEYDIKDIGLSQKGKDRIEWAERWMPVLKQIRETFIKSQPLKGLKVAACLHVTTETASLMLTLKAGGADIRLCASNPLSTQDDVTAALVNEYEIPVFAIKGEDNETYYKHINAALDFGPRITMDDGADLVSTIHSSKQHLLENVIGGTEETTTGVLRLNQMAKQSVLKYPIIAINDALTKHFFDNRYGTGQSTIDGILRATNILFAGMSVVIAGYGWCGRGVAMRAEGMGANVIITEVDPLKALEAVMDGYSVMPMHEAASVGDVFITVTGNKSVLRKEHFEKMKDGAIMANAGHFNVEINISQLEQISSTMRDSREFVKEYTLANGRRLYVLADGRLINLSSAEGHPSQVMDMSFANQALSVEYLLKHGNELKPIVFKVPDAIDHEIARLKLKALNKNIDALTDEQIKYINTWEEGT